MNRRILILSVAALVVAGVAAAGDDDGSAFTWTSDGGGSFVVTGGAAIVGDDGERTEIDLAGLRDGEARTIPTDGGDIVATREGDVVTLSGPGLGGDRVHRIGLMSCDGGDCPHAVSIARTTACEDGDCRVATSTGNVTICTTGDDDGDDTDCRSFVVDALGGGHVLDLEAIDDAGDRHVTIRRSAHGGMPHIVVGGGDRVMLRCPEGDTTMTVAKDRAEEVFLCPDHSLPLERVASTIRSFTVTVDDEDGGASEY